MNKKDYNNALLIKWREAKQVTQQSVADAVNVDRQTIYRAEYGRSASYPLLKKLCVYYEKTLEELLKLEVVI